MHTIALVQFHTSIFACNKASHSVQLNLFYRSRDESDVLNDARLKLVMPGLLLCPLSVFGGGLEPQVIIFGQAWRPKLFCFFGRGLEAQKLFCTGPWPQNLVNDFILIMHACFYLFCVILGGGWGFAKETPNMILAGPTTHVPLEHFPQ